MNPHRAGFAGVANFDPGFPGWTMEIDPSIGTLPRLLRNAGYATFAAGKWHSTRDKSISYLKSLRPHDSTHPFFLYLAHWEGGLEPPRP